MTLETLTNCPVCQSAQFIPYLQAKDYTVSQEVFKIVACTSCGFLFTNPRPAAEAIGKYYESSEYISHHDEGNDVMSRIYTGVRNYTTRQKVTLLNQTIKRQGTLLDIGCGTGFFLSQAKKAGWQVVGTEPDAQARAVGHGRVGESVFESIEAPFFSNTIFDAVTMWHVLEHVHLLNETFEWLHEHLAADGKLFIAVPNPESHDAQKFKNRWAAYDVPRHLYHFSSKSLQYLAGQHHFTVEKILPMWFDSYYVGMLSTRYESGKTNLVKSVWEGTLSNWKGREGKEAPPNTSSLIYVLGKE